MFVDTHAHLYFDQYAEDFEEVLARAKSNDITHIVMPAVDLETSKHAVDLANTYPELYAAVGVHPNSAQHWHPSLVEDLRALKSSSKVVAIGEIGLDYYRDYASKENQWRALSEQLKLATECSLPIILHTRDHPQRNVKVFLDLQAMLKEWKEELKRGKVAIYTRPGVLHAFSGSVEEALMFVEMGFVIGIAGPVTYPNAEKLREVVRNLPLSSTVIETDSPFLTPQKFRGKRNEPSNVRFVADKMAELHSQLTEEVGRITSDNAKRLFNW